MENEYEYVVKEGDTLSDILYNLTGDGTSEMYNRVAADNNISNADQIVPGQKITINNEYINNSTIGSSSSNSNVGVSSSSNANAGRNGMPSSIPSGENSTASSGTSTTNTNSGRNGMPSNIPLSGTTTSSENGANAVLFESEDQAALEEVLAGKQTTSQVAVNDNLKNTEAQVTGERKAVTNDRLSTNHERPATTNNSSTDHSTGTYIPSDYEICYPQSVSGFDPRDSFKTFQIKENAGDHFVAVNNQVRKCGTDIDGIISSLNTLKTKMGENTGTTTQIEQITSALAEKKQDLITKNSELIEACYEVLQYVYENKSSKADEASAVYDVISSIDIYKG